VFGWEFTGHFPTVWVWPLKEGVRHRSSSQIHAFRIVHCFLNEVKIVSLEMAHRVFTGSGRGVGSHRSITVLWFLAVYLVATWAGLGCVEMGVIKR
jgi:hypothetical protein